MRWDRERMKDLSIGNLARLRNLSLDDLPWVERRSPWPMVGMFGLGLGIGVLAGMAVGAGPARAPVVQAAGWTRVRGQQVAQRVRRPSTDETEEAGAPATAGAAPNGTRARTRRPAKRGTA